MQFETFLVRNLYTFYFRQCPTVSLKLSSIFVILFFSHFNGLFRYIKMKTHRDFQSVFTSMVDAFSNCKVVQSAMGRNRNIDTIMDISVAHGQPPLFYSENKYKPQQQHSFPLCWLALTHCRHSPTSEIPFTIVVLIIQIFWLLILRISLLEKNPSSFFNSKPIRCPKPLNFRGSEHSPNS